MSSGLSVLIFAAAFLATSALAVDGPPDGAKVDLTTLPNVFPQDDNRQFSVYSGYLVIDSTTTPQTQFFYTFVTQQKASYGAGPVLLWLNGGPGCSSLDGLFYEHGPWIFPKDDTTLQVNPNAWNQFANVLYIESPAGVGFSAGNPDEVHTDDSTAEQNLKALIAFYAAYPEYLEEDLYLSGESYAGIYIPSLAGKIMNYNKGNPTPVLPFKGFAVGNGVVNVPLIDQYRTAFEFAYNHNLLAYDAQTDYNTKCAGDDADVNTCSDFVNTVIGNTFDKLNPYNIYEVCYDDSKDNLPTRDNARFLKLAGASKLYAFNPYSELPPCAGVHGLTELANNKDFQNTFHITGFTGTWSICAEQETFNYDQNTQSFAPIMAETYAAAINAGLKVIYYSGDADSVCSIDTAKIFFDQLFEDYDLAVTAPKTKWHIPGSGAQPTPQVVGLVETRSTFQFVQVLGVGHMVPQWSPIAAAKMIQSLIEGTPLD